MRHPIPCLGTPPSNWQITRNRNLFHVIDERSIDGSEELLTVSHITGVTPRSEKDVTMFMAESLDGYKRCRSGDLVINTMWAWMGALAVTHVSGIVSPSYHVYRPKSANIHSRFFNYFFRTAGYITEITRNSRGVWTSRLRLYPSDFLDLECFVPPLAVQRAIADFLDRKTAAIDVLIEKKERLIALLAEKRAALIHDRLSNIKHSPTKLSYLVDLLHGFAYSSDSYIYSEAEPDSTRLLRGINISPGATRWKDVVFLPNLDFSSDIYSLRPGDLVLGLDRPWIGSGLRLAEIDETDCPALLVQRVARIRPLSALCKRYLTYTLLWSPFRAHIEPETTGVSVPHISPTQILSYKIPLPSRDEQRSIAEQLDSKTSQLRSMSEKLVMSVAKLKEYRQSLITAAVTGQLEIPA
ncbi:restriction endonuclease subunit S [Enhygromyxa salina]|uniref:Type-1 restriction enzyme EcoKI specificity protein n=1 Tax=Enhygromyxa salina TaxID=215803 RepID=A0A2S9Y3J7_9BACT|nr:restriction endonuclease subunit S [Enhygromyxa salina]PRP99655.1 Type-1 restriction enzyme EcoKI specificity protein [Enhygromyxa salina]